MPLPKSRLSKFEDTIARADAQYFTERGFISKDTYDKVTGWLNGQYEDPEAARIVAEWFESDCRYGDLIEQATTKYFWYISPAVVVALWKVRKTLSNKAKQLRGGA